MPKKKKFRAKELKRDPFYEWYEKRAEWARRHRAQIRQTVFIVGTILVLLAAGIGGYSLWKTTAEKRLARAFDLFNAPVGETSATNSQLQPRFKTEEQKYRAALQAYKRVSDAWYYRFSDYGEQAQYYVALCQLHLDAPKGEKLLEELAKGDTVTARLARVALAEHFIAKGEPARARELYEALVKDPGPLPLARVKLALARALALEGKKDDAVALYVEVAKAEAQKPDGREAILRLAELDPAALDEIPQEASTPPPDALARYQKK
ncbi:MAG: hypothetical protein D6723_01805 [Acidobacteria bacterium]|nr:MAG: hypothetical protein D6723_01805 [Acidobacteriota bacterium]